MTTRRGDGGAEPGLGRQIFGRFYRRGILIPAIFVLATLATVVGARATTHQSAAQLAVARSASASLQPSRQGAAKKSSALKAGIARRGHLPKTVKQSHPRELRLKAAHSKVFDVRKLKSDVVKKERPERAVPGFAPAGSRAAEALENPPRTAPQLPKVIKQSQMVSAPAPAPDSSFDGLDFANWGQGHPPDTNGDVGPTYYIQTINVSIGIYDKSSGSRVAAFTFNSFMSQGHFGNQCDTNNFGDPVVLYDSFENRWFISDFAFTLDGSGNVNPQHAFQCFAVSKTGDPVNGGWNFYSIEAPGGLGDYPKFGVWPDGIYMSANMFGYSAGGSYIAPHVWALNKQQMYNGDPAPQVVDFSGPSADFTVIPANARLQTGTPPAGTPEYFTATEEFLNAQTVYKFHVDWDKISTSTFTGPDVPLAPTCWPAVTPANASTPANAADVLAIRAMAQTQYTNIGGAESLWVDHTVDRGEIPTASCGATTAGNAATRWYQINVTGGTVAANDVQGHTYDPDGNNTFFRFVPSLAVDRVGDMAVGYTKSNSTTFPQLKYAGRLTTDPVNTFSQDEQTLINGTGAQQGNCGSSACVRWGDYSGMALDPNGCEFWETGEYFATTGLNHQTRIGSFHFPGCTTVGNGTLSGTVTDGASPIQGATVSLGNRTATTDTSGAYSFTVPAGTYPTETAAKPGFDPASASTLAVPDGGTLTKNFTLSASAQSGCFTDNTQSTFQRGVPNGCDLTTSPGSVQLKRNVAINQTNTTVTNSGFGVNSTSWAGQTFIPSATGQMTEVDLDLFCSGCTGTTPNLTVSLRATSGGVPTGADLATATIPGFNSASGGFFAANFASPPTLTAGTQYAIVFRPVSNPSAGTYAYVCSCAGTGTVNSNPYANGLRVTSANSGSTWTQDTTVGGRDLGFNVWMNQGFSLSGTFTSSLKDANPAAGRTPTWTTLTYAATTPTGTAVKFQVAASNNAAGPFSFVGPDGTANTFFTTSGVSLSQFNGLRYLKYQATLTTTNSAVTPSLSSVQVCFVDTAATSATSLAVAPATGTFGGTTTLSATLTSSSVGVPSETVNFTLNGTSVGSAITNASGVATLSNVSLAGINAGAYPTGVGASFPGDGSFDPSTGSSSLTVSKADQAINVTTHAPATAVYNTGFSVAATGGASGNAVTFSSSGACSNTGANFTMTSGTGTCTVKYDQAGTVNYNPAPQVTESVTAQKASQTITVNVHAPASATYNDTFGVSATALAGVVTFSSAGSCSNTGASFTMTSGTGTCTVKYDQAGDSNYSAAPQVTETVNAQKANQAITVTTHAPASAAYNTSFSVAATADGGAVSFTSSGSCTNAGATFTMTSGTGTCTVKYDQAGDANYNAATQVVETVNAVKADQTINVTTHAPASAAYNSSFSVAATAPGGTVSFSSSGSCSNTGATFTISSGSGTCTVNYDQPGGANYNAAPQVTESVTATKANQTIIVTLHAPASAVFGGSFSVAASGGGSGNAVTFSSSGSCSNSGDTFTMTSGTGTCTVNYDQAGDANYNAASQVTETVNALKADQTINVTTHAPASASFNQQFTVAATGGGSGNAVTFSSAGACSNTGATFTITNASGTCSVKYDQAGDANYNAAPQVTESVSVGKTDQTITVTQHAPASAVYSTSFSVAATAPGGAVTFSSAGSCSNTGATFTITSGTGTCTVNYDQAGGANFNPAPQVTETVNAQKADQTINVTTHAPASAAYNSSFSVAASAPGGSVSFTSSGSCSNTGTTFTISSGSGTCTVNYDQPGGANYNAAPQVTESVTATKANQTIIVTLHAPASAVYNTSFSVAASGGGSGNAVTVSSSGSCSNSGDTFTMTSGTGTCTVKYDQAGDANYNAASQVTESVTAQKASQTITFAPLPDRTYGDPDFTVSATASSGLSVSFAASGQCTVTGTTVHLTGPGSCTITASQGGDSNYVAATDVSRTFQINAPAQTAAQFTDDVATCAQVAAGTAPVLSTVNYTDKKGVINKATPNLAVYWVKVTVPAGPRTVAIDQSITSGNFTQKLTLANGSKVVSAACGNVKQQTVTSGANGSVTVAFTAPTAGTYRIAVRYHSNAVNGQATPAPTTIHYLFSAAGVSGSTATLDFLRQVAARPATSRRSAGFLRFLRR